MKKQPYSRSKSRGRKQSSEPYRLPNAQFLAVLGRQPLISIAELESLFDNVSTFSPSLATFDLPRHFSKNLVTEDAFFGTIPNINRLGGSLKIATRINQPIILYLEKTFAETTGKITLGVSDYSVRANSRQSQKEALRLKRILVSEGKSVRVVPNKAATISSASSLHNRLFTENKIEIIKYGNNYFRVVACQNIEKYASRDQARPARDAKVGMLPPKLAQILINLNNPPDNSRVLDPFCGTGVVLQEALLMNYRAYGSDLEPRMIEYSEKNLNWLKETSELPDFKVEQGDATSHQWSTPLSGVACEVFLGQPMSQPPVDIKLKQEKQRCKEIILGFLKNLSSQIQSDTPVTIAIPAWLRPNGNYSRLDILDEITKLGYNVKSFKNLEQSDLLYHRDRQVVAREIISLRKK